MGLSPLYDMGTALVAELLGDFAIQTCRSASAEMGLAPGGKMRQEISEDPFDFDDWDLEHSSRCFLHIANSLMWQAITDSAPPLPPPTAEQYTSAGLPWFDYYSDQSALGGSERFKGLKSWRFRRRSALRC